MLLKMYRFGGEGYDIKFFNVTPSNNQFNFINNIHSTTQMVFSLFHNYRDVCVNNYRYLNS
eukprot:gnl/Chilomastix_caulleri/2771.p1 GENE.gnl/Chilomastix_caulleri/2771~~gnl/Chilomastix_caulleri/2771.p1  ORF type:complete len:61 (+),score=7.38 gnl/Chilomastix_caulleri/2771:256-438(+)